MATNMESALYRISSFKNWSTAGNPLILSRQGFYYGGRDRTVVCHLCRSEFDDWNDVDELLAIHRVRSPECSTAVDTQEIRKNAATASLDVTDHQQSLPMAKFAHTSTFNANASATASAPRRVTVDSASASTDFDELRSERLRLETFHNWPDTAARVVDPRDLAEAGLYYTGQGDRVQCAFCRGFLRNWIRGDRPKDEHRKHFPDCPFVRELDVGNLRYQETSNVPTTQHATYQTSAADARVIVNLTETAPNAREPAAGSRGLRVKHPEFVDVARRIQSYGGKRVGNGQTVEGLANAGFFHVGPEDNVRCFQCDGGLKNWQPTDDPWTEHARWFPRCPFLLASKDQAFIRDAQIVRSETPNRTFQQTSNTNAPRGRYHVEPREIKARMDSATVQAIINMGYRRELVRQVIERRLTTTGDDFPNTQSLLEAVFEMEDDPSLQQDANTADFSRSSTASTLVNSASFRSTASITSEQRSRSNLVDNKPEPLDSDAQAVLEENRRLREARTCSVCMDKEVNTVFLPCGHLVCCNECSQSLTNCAVCRALIRGTVKIFLS